MNILDPENTVKLYSHRASALKLESTLERDSFVPMVAISSTVRISVNASVKKQMALMIALMLMLTLLDAQCE